MSRLFAIAVVLAGTLLGAAGALFLKLGSQRMQLRTIMRNWQFMLGAGLYCVGFIPYLFGLSRLPLSIAYPLTSMTYIWSALLAKNYLNERIDAWRWGGIGCIILGIILLAA